MNGPAGMDWQTVQFPLAGGLDTKTHAFLVEAPSLVTCKNAEFDELGAARLRKPFADMGLAIHPSGTISGNDVRKVVPVGDELLLFTKDSLYVWSETLSKWVIRGEHLAVATSETSLLGNTSDQVFADRAQLGGLIVYVWTDVAAGATLCYLAAIDATTGSTVIAPTSFGSGASRPRVIAGTSSFWVMWIKTGTGLVFARIQPSVAAFDPTSITTVSANETRYDAVHAGADVCVCIVPKADGTSYTVARLAPTGILTTATKARTADVDEPVALSVAAAATRLQVFRVDRTGGIDYLMGDLLNLTTLADVFTGQQIAVVTATTVNQIACAHRSVTDGGFYRCYVFWSQDEDSAADAQSFGVKTNYVDTNNTISAASMLVYRHGVASRAFDYGGRVFLWTTFASANDAVPHAAIGTDDVLGFEVPVQNTNYLFRDDGDFFAKAAWSRAGGFGYHVGHLAGVALVGGSTVFATAATERSFTELGGYFNSRGYGDRSPRDIVFTFDSDSARRVVLLGKTAYVSGGLVQQYDGDGLAEVGFEQFPWYIEVQDDGTAGTLAAGKYSYKGAYRWVNGRGEVERSTTAIGLQITVAASKKPLWQASSLRTTKKQGSRRKPALEMWRTQKDPAVDSPYYLITSRDPSATGANGYVVSDPTVALHMTERDNLPDTAAFGSAKLTDKEQHPENGAVLPRFAPPPATILCAGDARIFLAGVPAEPHRIWYSLLRDEGEIAGFHPALVIALPTVTGAVTALAIMDGTLVAWTATSCYAIPGDGFDNAGGGANYGPARLLSTDVGAISQDSVALTPSGLVFFSRKGWYRLGRGWDLEYIGGPVEDFNGDTFVAAHVVESQHQARFLSSSRMLVWDYSVGPAGQWSEWTITNGRGLAMWRSTPVVVDTSVRKQVSSFATVDYDLDVEMLIRLAGPQGFARVRWIMVLGEYKAQHSQRVRVAFNYATTYADDRTKLFSGLSAGAPTQLRHGPSQQRVEALKVRVTVSQGFTPADLVTLTSIALEVGLKRGLYRRVPASQNQ